jgi:hypothetical protein
VYSSDLDLLVAGGASGIAMFALRTEAVADVTESDESIRCMEEHCFIPDHLSSSSEKRACRGDLNGSTE